MNNLETCEFIEATSIVPREWDMWFWALISVNAPFSWGDNNRSMVTASDFRRHCDDRLLDAADDEDVSQGAIDSFLKRLEDLEETYIDLEN